MLILYWYVMVYTLPSDWCIMYWNIGWCAVRILDALCSVLYSTMYKVQCIMLILTSVHMELVLCALCSFCIVY